MKISIAATVCLLLPSIDCAASVIYFGPTPYTQRSDSPFADEIASGVVKLEDFEDGLLNSGFVSTPCADVSSVARPSVDEDDGTVDGIGRGRSLTDLGAPICLGELEIHFQPDAQGRLPNFVGFVVVGSVPSTFVNGMQIYQSTASIFDANNLELSDGRFFDMPDFMIGIDSGSTYYSRFIGFGSSTGIARLTIDHVSRIDHLQYGFVDTIPEPSVSLLILAGIGFGLRRRRGGNQTW